MRSRRSSVSWNSASVSPGQPTMTSVTMAASGMSERIFATRSSNSATV
jgi:hypothetical protein